MAVRIPLAPAPGSDQGAPLVVTIAAPADGNYAAALDRIFVDSLQHLAPLLPDAWQEVAAREFNMTAKIPAHREPGMLSVGGSVEPQRLTRQTAPTFSDAARNLRHPGVVVVGLVIDTKGNPTRLRIRRPAGLGLDEKALEAVSSYRFAPMMRDGVDVPVYLEVQVAFQVF